MFSLDNDPQFKRNNEFHKACMDGDTAKAVRLLDENPDDHHLIDVVRSDFPAILYAASNQHWGLCVELINRGVNLNVENNHRFSPLHVFAMHGHEELIKLAIENAAFVDRRDKKGQTALYYAAQADREQVCELLMSLGAHPNTLTMEKDSPMHCAARNGNTELAKKLIERGGYAHGENDRGETPITLAKTDEMRSELESAELRRVMREAEEARQLAARNGAPAAAAADGEDSPAAPAPVEEAKPKRRILKA